MFNQNLKEASNDNGFSSLSLSKICMQGCLDKPNCVASMLDEGANKCFEYYQTPRQEYSGDSLLSAYLCRTRALQVCYKHPGWRTHEAPDPGTFVTYPPAVDIFDDEVRYLYLPPENIVHSILAIKNKLFFSVMFSEV